MQINGKNVIFSEVDQLLHNEDLSNKECSDFTWLTHPLLFLQATGDFNF